MQSFKLVTFVLLAAVLLRLPEWSAGKLLPRRGKRTFGLNYQGNQWNGGVNYEPHNGGWGLQLGKNGKRTFGLNYQGKQWNGGLNYEPHNGGWGLQFGKNGKRNQLFPPQNSAVKMPAQRLAEIINDLAVVKSRFSNTALKYLSLPPHNRPITNEILIWDIRCLLSQMIEIVPKLKTLVERLRMMYKNSSDWNLGVNCKNLKGKEPVDLAGNDLVQIKRFVAALIKTEAELGTQ